MKRKSKSLLALLFAMLLIFSMTATAYGENNTESVGEEQEELPFDEDALTGKGAVSYFIGESFYDKKIKTDDDAYDAVYSVLEDIGGDDTTELVLKTVQPTEDGTSYYMFAQFADMIEVYGASVKLIVDKDQNAIGLVSTLVPDLKVSSDQKWEIDGKGAEDIIKKQFKDDPGIKIIQGVTEETVIPGASGSDVFVYCWVVYTNNTDPNEHAAYLANYVSADGIYLYSIPVASPGNKEALSGSVSTFAFDSSQWEKGEWSGTVTKHDGKKEKLTLPVMIDKKTGEMILGDLDRKILCVDYADFSYKDTLTPRASKDGKFADNELLVYSTFIDVYDLYNDSGWEGPDGQGTPSLLKMDMVDPDGEVIRNANYSGLEQGFRSFSFNRMDPDGECCDVIAHEFTHCFTETCMTKTIYENDYGAINEGISDALGNIIEALLEKTEDTEWLIQENGNEVIRSMSDPNKYGQPAFVWDRNYVPPTSVVTDITDYGGVHINSSLLNVIAYALNKGGMPLEDQMYFWMNVSLAMTPRTDFAQMSELMPWCMKYMGYTKYLDTLKKAIDKTGIADRQFPEKLPKGTGVICMEFPKSIDQTEYPCIIDFNEITKDSLRSHITWPDAGSNIVFVTLDEGDYCIVIYFLNGAGEINGAALATAEGWVIKDMDELQDFFSEAEKKGISDDFIASVEDGSMLRVEMDTLAAEFE